MFADGILEATNSPCRGRHRRLITVLLTDYEAELRRGPCCIDVVQSLSKRDDRSSSAKPRS